MKTRFDATGRGTFDLQFVRFLATGALNTLFGYTVYFLGLAVRASPELALLVATCLGALFNYITTARLVFRHRTMNRIIPFIGTYTLVYIVNVGAIRALQSAGLTPALAQALLLPVMAMLSFALFRFLVFRPVRPL